MAFAELAANDEQRALCETARRYLKNACPPNLARAGADPLASESWRRLADLGWLALPISEARGGLGGEPLTLALLMTEIGRALEPKHFLASAVLGGVVLDHCGDTPIVRELIATAITGERLLAVALYEPGAGYEERRIDAVAEGVSERWHVSGEKALVLGAPDADIFIIPAKTVQGETAIFAIEASAPGLGLTTHCGVDGLSCADIALTNAPAQLLCGSSAYTALAAALDAGTLAVCWEAVGIMRSLIELTASHLEARTQFGRRLAEFQVLQHRMSEMYLECYRAECLSIAALEAAGAELPTRMRALSSAKALVGRAARFVGQQAVQLHGGMGVSAEHIVSHYFRRLTAIDALFGNSDHHLSLLQALDESPRMSAAPSRRRSRARRRRQA